MTWLPFARAMLWIAVVVATVLLTFYLFVYEFFEPGTPLSRLQRRIEMARLTTVLDRPQEIDGALFLAGTQVRWQDTSHRRVTHAHPPADTAVLGVRATSFKHLPEAGWAVGLRGPREIDGWLCADSSVIELLTTGRLVGCKLLDAQTWRGWDLPEHSRVRLIPGRREVVLQRDAKGAWDTPFDSPVAGKMPWITGFNEDGSPSGSTYGREAPYLVAGQALSGQVDWRYDPATYGMGRERPPVSVSGFIHEGGTRRQVVLPWTGPPAPGREGNQ